MVRQPSLILEVYRNTIGRGTTTGGGSPAAQSWPDGHPCRKGTLSSIARTSSAVALRHYARTGGQRKVKWPPPFGGGHPRACGGTGGRECRPVSVAGLSPRLRGNQANGRHLVMPEGSIPAPAGEPCANNPSIPLMSVYPRACGGTSRKSWTTWRFTGLSPRLRGNHAKGVYHSSLSGSIPAPAGEPRLLPSC